PRGVDVHPHRGFETVTIAYQGEIAHRDNKGGGGVIGPGDVQWMTAASGVLHEEFHSESYSKEGGIFQMVQLWVNLPAKYKMSQPKYQPILKDSLVNVSVGGNSLVELVAGSYGDAHGPAETFSPLHISNVHLSGEDIVPFSFPSEWNIGLLVLEGGLVVNEDQEVAKDHFAVLNHDAASFELRALEGDAKVLLLAGEPIKEPIVSYGPFVMNTEEEIRQAITDFQQGVFGDWP
ncbi:MAG: pirin-like C-terminal cupin domain-containing protein, partial [Bacteroidota bacterium]|nr:pirin-like C-terminal cupin domain-containing protein [Bacteroidota bacterium]